MEKKRISLKNILILQLVIIIYTLSGVAAKARQDTRPYLGSLFFSMAWRLLFWEFMRFSGSK